MLLLLGSAAPFVQLEEGSTRDPSGTFQTFNVLSAEPDASSCPSGEKRTADTAWVWPLQVCFRLRVLAVLEVEAPPASLSLADDVLLPFAISAGALMPYEQQIWG